MSKRLKSGPKVSLARKRPGQKRTGSARDHLPSPGCRINKKRCPITMDQQQPNTDPTQHAAAEAMRRCRQAEREARDLRATLERERAAHGRSASAVAHHREASVVKLSIGGTHFTTSRSTLVPASGFFSVLLSGRFPPVLDDAGAAFVDRDALHFPQVLAFLRDGAMPRWGSDEEREALEREADFYQIEALMRVVGPAQNMVAAAGPTNERMRDEENELRALFVSARDDPRISHPHTHVPASGGLSLDGMRWTRIREAIITQAPHRRVLLAHDLRRRRRRAGRIT